MKRNPLAKPGVNQYRYDPYKIFTFRVKWNERYVAGISKISGIDSSRPNIRPRIERVPIQTDNSPITLERGVSCDLEFQQWAKSRLDAGNPPQDFRKELVIELYNQDGLLMTAYNVHRCWISKFITMPGMSENEAVIERIELQHEGWEQDPSVTGPDGPNFREPGF
jgi:phage tail-like protein